MKSFAALFLAPMVLVGVSAPVRAQISVVAADAQKTPVTSQIGSPLIYRAAAPCNSGGLVAGGSFYYLKPMMSGNTAYVTVTDPGQPNSLTTNTAFNWNLEPAFAT
jgi:hypothetical protein